MDNVVEERLILEEYTGFWKRVLASIIDTLILLLPTYLLSRLCIWAAVSADSALPLFVQYVLLIGFHLFMIAKFGGTPGKLILKVRIINQEGKYPTLKQAAIRHCFFIINGFLAVIVMLDTKELDEVSSSLINWLPLASSLNAFLGWIIIVGCLIVVFTQRNRALHDMMAGTYVVEKEVLEQLG